MPLSRNRLAAASGRLVYIAPSTRKDEVDKRSPLLVQIYNRFDPTLTPWERFDRAAKILAPYILKHVIEQRQQSGADAPGTAAPARKTRWRGAYATITLRVRANGERLARICQIVAFLQAGLDAVFVYGPRVMSSGLAYFRVWQYTCDKCCTMAPSAIEPLTRSILSFKVRLNG